MAENDTLNNTLAQQAAQKDKHKDLYQKNYKDDKICIEKCLVKGKDQGETIRCCLCAHWYHIDCIKLPKDESLGVWNCFTCRYLPYDIMVLQTKVSELTQLNTTLSNLVKAQTETINKVLTNLKTQSTTMNTVDKNVKSLTSHMIPEVLIESDNDGDIDSSDGESNVSSHSDELESSGSDSDDEDEPEPIGHMLIGDSLVKNVDPTIDGFTVNSHGGAKFVDVKKRLKNIKGKKYKDITIVCGTVDSSTKKPVDKIVDECKQMLIEAKSKADHVTLSSILPRTDDRGDMNKIDTLNQLIMIEANNNGVTFINNDENFRYRNDSPDESLLFDGLHLTESGVNRLLSNLNLQGKAKCNVGNGSVPKWDPIHQSNPHRKAPNISKPSQRSKPSTTRRHPKQRMSTRPMRTTTSTHPSQQSWQHLPEYIPPRQQGPAVGNPQTAYHIRQPQRRYPAAQHNLHTRPAYVPDQRRARPAIYNKHNNVFATRGAQPLCFNCGESGHVMHKCRFQAPLECWNCLNIGHKSKSCPF